MNIEFEFLSSVLRSVSTTRVDGCQKTHPSSRAVNSARELGPWTRVVETDL